MKQTSLDLNETISLKPEQIQSYRKNGFVRIDNVLSQEELEQVRKDLEEAVKMRKEELKVRKNNLSRTGGPFDQLVNLWVDFPDIRPYVLSKRIAEIARQLTGTAKMRLWHDHALIKPANNNKPSPWHQDWVYWPMHQAGALSCWMALDDVNEENGCLSFIPGSFKWGAFSEINLRNPQDIFEILDDNLAEKWKPVSVPLKAGSCTFHDGLTFHYAPGNKTNAPRRAMATIFAPDGTQFRQTGHVITDPLKFKDGNYLEGELFPVLAEGEADDETTFYNAKKILEEKKNREKTRLKTTSN